MRLIVALVHFFILVLFFTFSKQTYIIILFVSFIFTRTGDDDVLSLLKKNVKKNAGEGSSTKKLVWGAGDALEILELPRHPDFILATDVVYGNDTSKWKALVDTIKRYPRETEKREEEEREERKEEEENDFKLVCNSSSLY